MAEDLSQVGMSLGLMGMGERMHRERNPEKHAPSVTDSHAAVSCARKGIAPFHDDKKTDLRSDSMHPVELARQ